MSKNNIVLVVVVGLVLIGAIFWGKKMDKEQGYSVVYLTTGEVYIGKLSIFPIMELKDGYILTIVTDPNDPKKSNFQLNPLTEALWAPSTLHLVKDNVIFYGPLMSNSKIAETLSAQKKN